MSGYRLVGGPKNGETVQPPPSEMHAVTDALSRAAGDSKKALQGPLVLKGPGGAYVFSDDEPDVLTWVEGWTAPKPRPGTVAAYEVEAQAYRDE